MGLILGVFLFAAALVFEIISLKVDSEFTNKYFPKNQPFVSKLVVAFLCGLIGYALFTEKVDLFEQRIAIITASILLIYANVFLNAHRDIK
jgi:hypothetical protein